VEQTEAVTPEAWVAWRDFRRPCRGLRFRSCVTGGLHHRL